MCEILTKKICMHHLYWAKSIKASLTNTVEALWIYGGTSHYPPIHTYNQYLLHWVCMHFLVISPQLFRFGSLMEKSNIIKWLIYFRLVSCQGTNRKVGRRELESIEQKTIKSSRHFLMQFLQNWGSCLTVANQGSLGLKKQAWGWDVLLWGCATKAASPWDTLVSQSQKSMATLVLSFPLVKVLLLILAHNHSYKVLFLRKH